MSRLHPFVSGWLHIMTLVVCVALAAIALRSTTLYAQTGVAVTPTAAAPGGLPSSEPPQAVVDVSAADLVSPKSPSVIQGTWPNEWYTTMGAVFLPASSGYSYQYGNAGCLKSNTSGYWRASVHLPDRAVAKVLLIGYKNDTYSASSTAYFTKYKIDGNYQDLAAVSSRTYTTTNVGYFLDLSGEITETIDNSQYSYAFLWGGSTTQRLCSVRLGYYPPAYGTGLPAVLNTP